MSRVRLGPTASDGVMKRKAVNMNNGAMKKSHNMALVCLFFKEMKLKVSDFLN